ncbi:MAG: glycosyltransferase family 9 protein [Planctomycetes bacterium]|nr:glycosyltransferase family 9 protein [Planctomycetota bacterium]
MAAKTKSLATKIALFWARRHLRKHPLTPFEPLDADTPARILVVNTTGIGDTIFATSALADLRESFQFAHIAAFVDRRRVELLAGNPRVNQLIPYEGKFKQVRSTRNLLRGFDVAIIQHANDPDVVPLVASALPGALVGYESHTYSLLYAIKLPPANRAGGDHTIDARLALTRAVGASGNHWHPELFASAQAQALAADVLKQAGLQQGEAIALNLGGSNQSKRWPLQRWAELLALLRAANQQVLLVGGPDEAADARKLLPDQRQRALAGALPFMACAALLKLCRAHISADTGLMHAGLALDVPTVALFGPDDPKWTGPYPRQRRAVVVQPHAALALSAEERKKRTDLMAAITALSVVEALERV